MSLMATSLKLHNVRHKLKTTQQVQFLPTILEARDNWANQATLLKVNTKLDGRLFRCEALPERRQA
jgi:hypothetical protein